ncbi:Rnf-Nqr domain containing protein [uncultured Gemmiger sp.]|uniref:Rnf-Nqr domain containing protein n=1 Tax=uncultured Gemmiger sp. TaxID=1623490 RepID=UPI0025EA1E36|nr:Rnf-Nqr domain containing protein [uncultured Gemmiger sp.]
MPNPQNRNDRRKGEDRSETLIIPHITKEMLETARRMAEEGASRAEIEKAISAMQSPAQPAPSPASSPAQHAAPAPQPMTAPPERKHRIIPTSRPRLSAEERAALRQQMQMGETQAETPQSEPEQEALRQEAARRAANRPAWFGRQTAQNDSQEAARRAAQALAAAPHAPEAPAAPKVDEPTGTRTIAIPKQRTVSRPAEPAPEATRVMPAGQPQPTPAEPAPQPAARTEGPAGEPAPRPAAPAPEPRKNAVPRSRTEAENDLNEKIRRDHIWLSNPVMVRGLGMAPIVGAALDGHHALMLCVASLLLITFTRVLAVAVCHLTKNRFRPVIYSYAAALLYIPVYVLMYQLFGADLSLLGIYLPLLVVEPAIVKRMEFAELEPVSAAFRHGFNNSLGMCAALLIVGCLRELLATGAVFGNQVIHAAPLPLAAQPSGGFVLVGAIAAVWCAIANLYTNYKHEEVRRLYAKH